MYRRKPKAPLVYEFPNTMAGMGYKINEQHQLRTLEDDGPFVFEVKQNNRPYNESHYEALMDLIGDYIEDVFQNDFGLIKHVIPIGKNIETDMFSKIYMTKNALETTEKLLVLLPSSNIRIGQWSRRIIADEGVHRGSMIDAIKLAREVGFKEVFIFNPNENYWVDGKGICNLVMIRKFQAIPENETPEKHCAYVFKHFLSKAKSDNICMIAQGWGGHLMTEMLNKDVQFFKQKVQAVALANSVHTIQSVQDDGAKVWMKERVVNWMCSNEVTGDFVYDDNLGCHCCPVPYDLTDFIIPNVLPDIIKWFKSRTEITEIPDDSSTDSDDEKQEEIKLQDLSNIEVQVDGL